MKIRFQVVDAELPKLGGVCALVSPIPSDRRPLRGVAGAADWELGGGLSRTILTERFTGARGERLLVACGHRLPVDFLLLMGVGREESFRAGDLMPLFRAIARVLADASVRSMGISLADFTLGECDRQTVLSALLAGFLEGSRSPEFELHLLDGEKNASELSLEFGRAAQRYPELSVSAR